jgi:hypothetical protein
MSTKCNVLRPGIKECLTKYEQIKLRYPVYWLLLQFVRSFIDLVIDFAFDLFVVKFGMKHSLSCEFSKAYCDFLYVSSGGK